MVCILDDIHEGGKTIMIMVFVICFWKLIRPWLMNVVAFDRELHV
jgi:hypothetical protein